jgi:hypothetical protein
LPNLLPRWPGATIVCLASGPTLTEADAARVRAAGLPAIAVNDAIRLAPWAPVLYSSDRGWWRAYRGVPEFAGLRVSVGERQGAASPIPGAWATPIVVLTHTGVEGLEADPGGLRTGGNSGYAAINLAVHLGARTILLLGYQGGPHGGRSHFFGRHPSILEESSAAHYAAFRRAFETLVPALAAAGITIRNCTPGTHIAAFETAELGAALAAARPPAAGPYLDWGAEATAVVHGTERRAPPC